jgi:hypothetical protein
MSQRGGLLPAALSASAGVVVAVGLVGLLVVPVLTSTVGLAWTGPEVFSDAAPREFGAGGPTGPTNCTVLHVRFNASGPIISWVAPGGAVVYPNGTISRYWASAGPASAGQFAVQVPSSSTGYRVVLYNPSWTATLPSMQFETAETAC